MDDEVTTTRRRTRKAEPRGQWCIKHAKMTEELKDLCWQAADKAKVGVNEWAADALRAHARYELSLDGTDNQEDTLIEILARLDRIDKALLPANQTGVAQETHEKEAHGLLDRVLGRRPKK